MPADDDNPPEQKAADHGVSRRRLLGAAGIGTGAAMLGIDPTAALGGTAESSGNVGAVAEPAAKLPKTPDEALAALVRGNKRYATNNEELRDYTHLGEEIASKHT